MRVLYNGLPLLAPRTGVGRYMTQLCRALLEIDSSLSCGVCYLLSTRRGLPDGRSQARAAGGIEASLLPPAGGAEASLLRTVQGTALAPVATALHARVLDALLRLPVPGRGYDLYHETHYVPRRFHGPSVMTVYDLSLALHPETQPALRVELFRRRFARGLPRMDFFLAITHVGKAELAGEFGVDPARIRVTHLGVDPEVFRPGQRDVSGASPYVLCVGAPEPRKDLPTLLEAFARLPERLRDRHRLVLAGPAGWKTAPLWRRVRELGLPERVAVEGYVTDARLAELYRGASALAYPSRYEGFGLPVVEAMACGTPVLCSEIPVLAEVAGDAALRLPVGDVEAWRDGLARILESEELRARLRAAGLERAHGFSWRACARETLEVYRALAA